MVDMSGDRAQGFLLDVRSCSNVGSMKLGLYDVSTASGRGQERLLHEFKSCARTPGQLQRMVECVAKEHIVCRDGTEKTTYSPSAW